MSSPSTLHIAIIGSGPAGCYLAQSLLRAVPDSEITLFDQLASPFGLVRYGVAADHQHTKSITRQFERLFTTPNVRFAGDVSVGRDTSLAELQAHFDVVVAATGLSADRGLQLPGGELPGVIGSGEITRILNAHPGAAERLPQLGPDIVLVGAGNVALDILRFLVKDHSGYAGSDVADEALTAYLESPAQRITLVSRSAAAQSKGDPQMLKELAALPRARYFAPGAVLETPQDADRTTAARVAAVAELISEDRESYPGPEVDLRFGATPIRIHGDTSVTSVEFTQGAETVRVPATSVITAIGFDADSTSALTEIEALPPSAESGRVSPGLYRTGWAKRGPIGAIPENRACAKAVAEEITSDLHAGTVSPDPAKLGYAGLPESVRNRAITFAQWQVLDAHECKTAGAERVRRKLPHHDQMAAIARGAAAHDTQA